MTYDRSVVQPPAVFPTRILKAYSVSSFQLFCIKLCLVSMLINPWRISLAGDRSNCGDFCCIRRDYCTQHGRFATWTLLVCHIFLDSCCCKFFLLKHTLNHNLFNAININLSHNFVLFLILCSVFQVLLPVMSCQNTPTNVWWVQKNTLVVWVPVLRLFTTLNKGSYILKGSWDRHNILWAVSLC